MVDELIKFETAILAKEKGFDLATTFGYNEKSSISVEGSLTSCFHLNDYGDVSPVDWNNRIGKCYNNISAPTQSLLQRWLREVHGINVESNWLPNIQKYRCMFKPMDILPKEFISREEYYNAVSQYFSKNSHNTYEEALEEGLLEGLKLIK